MLFDTKFVCSIYTCRVFLLLTIEYCWNVYPSTVLSSTLLHSAHSFILLALYLSHREPPYKLAEKKQ